jgi:hypothetical protein
VERERKIDRQRDRKHVLLKKTFCGEREIERQIDRQTNSHYEIRFIEGEREREGETFAWRYK